MCAHSRAVALLLAAFCATGGVAFRTESPRPAFPGARPLRHTAALHGHRSRATWVDGHADEKGTVERDYGMVPLWDSVLLRVLDPARPPQRSRGGLLLPQAEGGQSRRHTHGEVVATGPGRRGVTGGAGDMCVRPGDVVLFDSIAGADYRRDGAEYRIVPESSIVLKFEGGDMSDIANARSVRDDVLVRPSGRGASPGEESALRRLARPEDGAAVRDGVVLAVGPALAQITGSNEPMLSTGDTVRYVKGSGGSAALRVGGESCHLVSASAILARLTAADI